MAILSGDPQEEIFGLMVMAEEDGGCTTTTITAKQLSWYISSSGEKNLNY